MSNPLDQPVIDTPDLSPSPAPAATATEKEGEGEKQTLAIEDAPQKQGQEEEGGEGVHKLDLGGGNVVKLDKLGPMIINSDGTLSRIQNWQDLHPIEQERTVRLLVKKRNLVRLKQQEEKEAGGEGQELSALKGQ
ncbi:hypothetical protein IAR50_006270 [Cryptococcus sp. DSM 104548]